MWHEIWLALFALVCWASFNVVGSPLLRFFDLRTEVRRTMILFANVRARWTDADREGVAIPVATGADLSPDEQENLKDAQIQYRDLEPFRVDLTRLGIHGTLFLVQDSAILIRRQR